MGSSSGSDSYGNQNITLEELEKKAPEGEFVAYINPREAKMLKDAGGSGKLVNGIPSFEDDDPGDTFGGDDDSDDDDGYGGGYSEAEANAAGVDTSQDSSYGGGDGSDGIDNDATYNAADAYFTPTQEDPSVGEQITDFIRGGGLIGAGIRGLQDVLGTQPNQYAGIDGEDGIGIGEANYVSTLDDYTESRGYGKSYSDLNSKDQAFIDKEAFDAGYRSESFNDLYNTGDTSNLQNLNQAESDFVRQLIPQAPFLIGGGQAPKSMVNDYFSNLQTQQNSGGILDRYNEAKSNISGILGTNNQLGVSNTTNFYYDYLTKQGLL